MPSPEILDIGGRGHAVYRVGDGSPAVVFEAAIGDVGLTWGLVFAELGPARTLFTHDRSGLGHSDPAPGSRTSDAMVDELRAALQAAGVAPPFVLVGHSFASLTVRSFAGRFPGEVSGLVLVDGAHEDQMERFPPELNPAPMLESFTAQLLDLADAAARGQPVPPLLSVPATFPEDLANAYAEATTPSPERLRAAAAEYEWLAASQDQVRRAGGTVTSIPLVALRHGIPQSIPGVADEINDRYEATWQDLQAELAARSTHGSVLAIEGAGHYIHHDRPDAVAGAIRSILAGRSS